MRSIFAVFAVEHPDRLKHEIAVKFGPDAIEVAPGQWLLSAEGTSQQVCEHLGLVQRAADGASFTKGTLGGALVVAISGYYGIKPANIWEWVKAHWEAN